MDLLQLPNTSMFDQQDVEARYLSVPIAFAALSFVILIYSVLVYVIPTLSGQDTTGAFDAFNYSRFLAVYPQYIVERQPFLAAYPSGLSPILLPIYATGLHLALLSLPLYLLNTLIGSKNILIIFAALAIPESALFLGAVSKEGLSIVAVIGVFTGYFYYFSKRARSAFMLWTYAIIIADYSRPGLGLLYGLAIFSGLYPSFDKENKRRILLLTGLLVIVCIWIILYGPMKEQAIEAYVTGKEFLIWFEENMGNQDSKIKSGIRSLFSLVFFYDTPTLAFIILATICGFLKAAIYFIALPVISLPAVSAMPSMTWALTWQFAVSGSSLVMIYNTYYIFKQRKFLTVIQRCLLQFSFTLFLIFSASTFIFHVRYRAPGVVAILIATWLSRGKGASMVFPLTLPAVCAAIYAIVITA